MSLPNKNLVCAILISISCFTFWAWVLPIYDSVSSLSSVVKDREALLASRQVIFDKIQNLITEYKKRTDDLNKLSSIIPQKANIPELISTVDGITSKVGLQLGSLDMQTTGQENADLKYNTISLSTGFTGDYSTMFNLLDTVEKSLRLIDVTELSVFAGGNSKSSVELQYSLKTNSYFLKDLGAIAKASDQSKPANPTNTNNNLNQ